MKKCNSDLREEAKTAGVCLWQIAEELGISEPTMTRRLRLELSQEEKTKIRAVIKKLAEAGENYVG